jgi:predicted acylesterase/phospholipase RssA
MDDVRIGVALSGGGHRASIFGIGALLSIIDTGLNEHVVSISSVSGGSIANGIAMTGPDFASAQRAELVEHLGQAAASIAERGALLGGAPATRWYVRSLVAVAAVTCIGLVVTIGLLIAHVWFAAVIGAIVTAMAGACVWILFAQRSGRTEAALDAEVLGDRNATLADQGPAASSVHHVICTTELQTGTSFFFTNRAVYGHQFGGCAAPARLCVSTAVQASACVPGAFGPRVIERRTVGLPGEGSIVAVDGGVYDNMADEWEYGYRSRTKVWPELPLAQPVCANVLAVVNASAGWDDLKPIKRSRLAVELAGLLRSKAVQYDVSTAHRRRALMERFRHDDDTGLDDGAFIQITASPYDAPDRFGGSADKPPDEFTERSARAREFLERSGYTPEWWASTVRATAGVKTTLAPLGVDTTALLLEHGYVLTLVNLYVMLGLGNVDSPIERSRFTRLATGGSTPIVTTGTQ